MMCYNGGVIYKLSPSAGYVPYAVVLGGDIEGLTPEDREFLQRADPTMVGHKWYWWDNPGGADPFALFKQRAATNPMWTPYSPDDERRVEELYKINPASSDPQSINQIFCVRFDCTYESKDKIMIQGRNDDENNSGIPDGTKRRRPIIRTSFCWCWEQTEGKGDWKPYAPEITSSLEEAFIAQKPEVDIQLGQGMYTVNFTQMYQFNTSDTSRRCNIKRFGTKVTDTFLDNLGYGGLSKKDVCPQTWEQQQQNHFCSQNINQNESQAIMQMVSSSLPCKITLNKNMI